MGAVFTAEIVTELKELQRISSAAKRKRYKKTYRQSEAGKAAHARHMRAYSKTENGKAAAKRCQEKYYATINGCLRRCYARIKDRCENPNNSSYKYYGGRGIELRFTSDEFVEYVVNVLQQDPRGLSIDRVDSDGHYEPGNIWFCPMAQNSAYQGRDHFGGSK